MKSALFSERNLLSHKGFNDDFKTLLGLGKKGWDSLLEHVLDFYSADNAEEDRIVEQTSKELQVPLHSVRTAFQVSEFFLSQFVSNGDARGDNPSDLVDDLNEPFHLDADAAEGLIYYFQALKEKAKTKGDVISATKSTAHSCLPNLVSLTTVLDYRIVFKNPYSKGTAVDAYVPEVYGAIPIGIIELNFGDEEEVKKVAFQADEKAIQVLISNLEALLKQVKATRNFFKFEGDIE